MLNISFALSLDSIDCSTFPVHTYILTPLIERNSFAKGMTLPEHLSSVEETTREYEIGDFGYWNAGPDLAIFYDDIYEQTIVEVIPLGHAETGAEAMANESGTVRLELMGEEEEQTENK